MMITQRGNRTNRFGDGSVELGGRVEATVTFTHSL